MQVFNCLKHLNISLSYTGMLKTIKTLCEDHGAWSMEHERSHVPSQEN